eukprot:COSAG02_NODE_31784_length_527_cov_0.988318_1_plen_125_part_01
MALQKRSLAMDIWNMFNELCRVSMEEDLVGRGGGGGAGTPRSAAGVGAGGDASAELETSAEYGTPRAGLSFDGLSAAEQSSSHQRQCFRWWKGAPSFDGTAPAKLFDTFNRADSSGGGSVGRVQV